MKEGSCFVKDNSFGRFYLGSTNDPLYVLREGALAAGW